MSVSSGKLDGKVVVVTGAGRGIGADIARLLGSQGASVVVNDLGGSESGDGASQAPAEQVVKQINEAGGKAVANYESVADWDAAHRIIEMAMDTFGRIDGVVNNAGILRDAIFHKITEEQWDAVIAVHLKGCFNVARAAAPHLRAQQSGSCVHMTSTSGVIGAVGQSNYAAAKLGIAALSKSIAMDMQRFNVRSNCIAPFAWSRLIATIPTDDPAQKKRVERVKQTMTTAQIAPLVGFLMSDEASDVSGQIFAVRGNEIFLMSQPRPIRSIHRGEGWTLDTIADHAMPALRPSLVPLERSSQVFSWEPV